MVGFRDIFSARKYNDIKEKEFILYEIIWKWLENLRLFLKNIFE